jgi:hypothetical protein
VATQNDEDRQEMEFRRSPRAENVFSVHRDAFVGCVEVSTPVMWRLSPPVAPQNAVPEHETVVRYLPLGSLA